MSGLDFIVEASARSGADWYKPEAQKELGWRHVGTLLKPKGYGDDPKLKQDLNAFINAVWRGSVKYAKEKLGMNDAEAKEWGNTTGKYIFLNFSDPRNQEMRSYITVPGAKKKLSQYDPETELPDAWNYAKQLMGTIGGSEDEKEENISNYLEQNKEAFSKFLTKILKDALKSKSVGSAASVAEEGIRTLLYGIAHNMAVQSIFGLVQYAVLDENNLIDEAEKKTFKKKYIFPSLKNLFIKMGLGLKPDTLDKILDEIVQNAKGALKNSGFSADDVDEISIKFKEAGENDLKFFNAVGENANIQEAYKEARERIYAVLENAGPLMSEIREKLVDKDVQLMYARALSREGVPVYKKKVAEGFIDYFNLKTFNEY